MKNFVVLGPAAEKFLDKLRDEQLYRRLQAAIDSLRANAYPHGAVKMVSPKKLYRIRIGDYHILYEVEPTRIVIGKIAHRREVYRQS